MIANTLLPRNRTLVSSLLAAGLAGSTAAAQSVPATNAPVRLPDLVVTGEAENDATVQGPFLPAVEGTRINAGKKTSVLDLDTLPKINNNNYRQALSQTPGLLLSEETSPLVSLGYRGLNPHRAQFTQVLKDGLPIHADQFGYPEAYYTPPLDTVDRIEFIRGGASLQFGPQPGGALNYVTHRPRNDQEFSFRTQQIFGSDSAYSTFNSVDGTLDRLGYYAGYNHRQTDGFRTANSEVDLHAGSAKLVLDADSDSRWILNFDGYAEEHGEPGGLTFATGPNTVNYNTDRDAASRFFDRFSLERYAASLGWERDFSENTSLTATAWGGFYSRFSKRQRGGGFGTLPTGAGANSNTIELQEFYTAGIEGRLRHDWTLDGTTQTFTAGIQAYRTDSPRTDERGATPDAHSGQLRNQSNRDVFYAPVFVENRFVFDRFSITPGVRFENLWQSVEEQVNLDKSAAGVPLGSKDDYAFVPLFGLGVEYEVRPAITAYGNLSQSYRPMIFTEAVPTGGTTFVNADLEEGQSWQGEIGLRGRPQPWILWDVSLFHLDFDNQIGTRAVPGGTTLENIGHTIHRGAETALEIELLGLADALTDRTGTRKHQVSLYGNILLLDAEIEDSTNPALAGNTPQYAPEYILRTGAIYRWQDRAKAAFLGTFVDDHYADDANSAHFLVPAYMVWDLTLECRLYRDSISLVAGINNLFDEDYYARIRGDGIDPAYGRNYYGGLSFSF